MSPPCGIGLIAANTSLWGNHKITMAIIQGTNNAYQRVVGHPLRPHHQSVRWRRSNIMVESPERNRPCLTMRRENMCPAPITQKTKSTHFGRLFWFCTWRFRHFRPFLYCVDNNWHHLFCVSQDSNPAIYRDPACSMWSIDHTNYTEVVLYVRLLVIWQYICVNNVSHLQSSYLLRIVVSFSL